jgi:hypothetical protein
VNVEREDAEFRAANERITEMAEELRKAELVRDRLDTLAQLMGSYPEGHHMRARLEALHVDRALEGVNDDIRVLTDALQHPRGTWKPPDWLVGSQDPKIVTREIARDLSALVGQLAGEGEAIGWSNDAACPYTRFMAHEDTILHKAMDNLKEAGQRIRATQSLMRSRGLTDGENHRDLLTRLSTALAMTEAAYLEARRRREL